MGVIVAIIGVCIPIVAIVGKYVSDYQKAKLEAGKASNQQIEALERKIDSVLAENKEMKSRLLNVETIVTDENFHVALPEHNEEESLKIRLEELVAKKKNPLKSGR